MAKEKVVDITNYVAVQIIFIKETVSKLHLNYTAFTTHLSLKVLDFSQV